MTTKVGRYFRPSGTGSNYQIEHCDNCQAILPRGRTFTFFRPGAEANTARFLCVKCHREASLLEEKEL